MLHGADVARFDALEDVEEKKEERVLDERREIGEGRVP